MEPSPKGAVKNNSGESAVRYDFDTFSDRTGTDAMKWDHLDLVYGDKDLVPLWVADMDFPSPAPVVDALVERARHGIYGYTGQNESLYEVIQNWLKNHFQWAVGRESVIVGPGSISNLVLLLEALTEPGDGVIIQPPVYHVFKQLIELNNRKAVLNPLVYDGKHYRMDLEDLRKKASQGACILILCSPHNPVGRVWTKEELSALEKTCKECKIQIISDEAHGDLVLPGHVHTPFTLIEDARKQEAIILMSPGKTFNLAGLQTSVLVIPDPDLREKYQAHLKRTFQWKGNPFSLVATEAAYAHGGEWLDQLLDYLQGNLDFLKSFLAEQAPQIKVVDTEGTYLVWVDFRQLGMNAEDLSSFLRGKARVAVNDGDTFGPGGEGFARINIACPRSMLKRALEQISEATRLLAI